MRVSNMPGQVSIIRGELSGAQPLNVEACCALFRAKIVFHAGCTPDEIGWLTDFAIAASIVDLGFGLGRVGPARPNLHRAMATRIVVAAQIHGDVVFSMPDHPQVTDLLVPFVLRMADRVDVPVAVLRATRCWSEVPAKLPRAQDSRRP